MRVLVACERSNTVRDAFLRRGHDAYSCDLQHADHPNLNWRRHIRGDVRPLLHERWDLVIAHPPCTYLCISGNRWKGEQRDILRQHAVLFFLECYNANADRVCVENPIGRMSTFFMQPTQIIQPWMFGCRVRKATCLWLRNLPLLEPTELVEPEEAISVTPNGHNTYSMSWVSPKDRANVRSKTFQDIADAMAKQWG